MQKLRGIIETLESDSAGFHGIKYFLLFKKSSFLQFSDVIDTTESDSAVSLTLWIQTLQYH